MHQIRSPCGTVKNCSAKTWWRQIRRDLHSSSCRPIWSAVVNGEPRPYICVSTSVQMFKCRCLTQLKTQSLTHKRFDQASLRWLVGWCILRCSPILASALGIHLSFLPCTDGQLQCLSRQTDKLHLPPVHSYSPSTL